MTTITIIKMNETETKRFWGERFFIHRSVVQMESMAVSKTSDFGSSPDRSAMALWCKIAAFGNDGNTSGSQYIRL